MKRLLFATVTFATICGGRLSASSVIDCSGTPGAINTCVASKLPSFQTHLDWAILGQPFNNGTPFNGTWSGSQDGFNIQVSPTAGLPGPAQGLRLAYNIGEVFFGAIPQWTSVGSTTFDGYTTPGHFNATADPAAGSATLLADPSIRLLGLALNGSSATPGLVLSFNNPFVNLGFYGSSQLDDNFALTIKIYSGAGGTGTLLSSDTFTYNSPSYTPGGTCLTMQQAPAAPVGCNDAPFFYASGYNNGLSAVITTTDEKGFYISNLYVGAASSTVPEPGSMVLCGCGIALLALGSRKLRRKAQ